MDEQIEQVIDEYKDAYQAVNGKAIHVDYFSGWFRLNGVSKIMNVQRGQLVTMTDNLKKRLEENRANQPLKTA